MVRTASPVRILFPQVPEREKGLTKPAIFCIMSHMYDFESCLIGGFYGNH